MFQCDAVNPLQTLHILIPVVLHANSKYIYFLLPHLDMLMTDSVSGSQR